MATSEVMYVDGRLMKTFEKIIILVDDRLVNQIEFSPFFRLSLDMAAAELPPMRSTPLPMHLMMSSGGRQMRGGTTLSSLPLTTFTARPNISKRTKDFLAQHAGTVGQSIGSGVDLVINRGSYASASFLCVILRLFPTFVVLDWKIKYLSCLVK